MHRGSQLVAIDALHFRFKEDQYQKDCLDRELQKAFVGFFNGYEYEFFLQ